MRTIWSKSVSHPTRAPWLLAVAAIALRVAVLLWRRAHDPLVTHPLNDAEVYLAWARAILAGDTFGPAAAPYYLAPLYPHVLAGMLQLGGQSVWLALVCQHLLGVGVVVGIWRLGREAGGERVGLLAGVLALVMGPPLWYEGWLLPTTLNLGLLVLALNLVVALVGRDRTPWWLAVALGLVLGLAAINRPQNLLLSVGLIIWLAVRARRAGGRAWWTPAVTLAATLLTIAPVTVQNLQTSGEPVLITANGGVNFYLGNHGGADGRFSLATGFPPTIAGQQQASRTLAQQEAGRALGWSAASRHWFGRAVDELGSDPVHASRLWIRKLRLTASWREMENNFLARWVHDHTGPGRVLVPSLALLWILAIPTLVTVLRRPAPGDVPLLILTAATLAICVLFWVSTRNRLPLMIPLAIWSARTLADRTLWRRMVPMAAAALMALAVVWPTGETEGAEFYVSLGGVHAQNGRFVDAREAFEQALVLQPLHPMAMNNLALTYLDTGDAPRAVTILRQVVQRYPDFELARRNLREAEQALRRPR